MYLLWPPTVGPEADRIVTRSCQDIKDRYQDYIACARHINEVVKALVDGTKILPEEARQIAWRRMVEICKYNVQAK